MGASTSGLSGSNIKEQKKEGREIVEERQPLTLQRHTTDAALREIAAGRIRSSLPDTEQDEVTRLASTISDGHSLQETFFPGLLHTSTTAGSLRMSIFWRDITGLETRRELVEVFDKFAQGFKYGPYCATVKIGGMCLEWDNRELVIPQTKMGPLFEDSSTKHSLSADSSRLAEEASGSENERNPPLALEDIEISAVFREDLEVDMTHRAAEKINSLMQTLVRYNTKFNFGLLSCNCQHFVADVLTALEVGEELLRQFEDCLAHHKRVLECRGRDVIKEEFNTHEELDTYVNIRLENMDQGEKNFCYGHYLLFHAWGKECPNLYTVTCTSVTCRLRELARRL